MIIERRTEFSDEVERLASQIVDAAFKVHTALGPGLLESVYEVCFTRELRKRGLAVRTQVVVPIVYDGETLDAGLRIDVIVENTILVELKAVDQLSAIHDAQTLTYLKLSGLELGFLINFNVARIKSGIKRIARSI